jgi:broad specificity phosphatase PhoE
VKAIQLTLVCHGMTEAQRLGRFALDAEPLHEAVMPLPGLSTRAQGLCAPELRTQATAQGLQLQASVDERLRDCDLGRWRGLALKQLPQAALQAWMSDPHAAPHGGESVAALCVRVAHWMDSALVPGEWIAVTHPMVMRAAMLHALGAALESFHRIDVRPLAQVRFSHYGQWRVQLCATEPAEQSPNPTPPL